MIFGYYERFTLDLVEEVVPLGGVVIDVGANIGLYSLTASRQLGPDGLVLAIEPEPANLVLLKENLTMNGAHNVHVEEAAIADSNGRLRLEVHLRNSGNHSLVNNVTRSPKRGVEYQEVVSATLSSLIAKHDLNYIDLIKIDIEGYEPVALSTVPGLSRMCRALMIEFVPKHLIEAGFDPRSFLRDLMNEWSIVLAIDEQRRRLERIGSTEDVDSHYDGNLLCLAELHGAEAVSQYITLAK